MKAGVPGAALNYLPSDHAGAGEVVRRCGRSMFFGDVAAVGAFAGDPRIELHGPGYSKVIFGADTAASWPDALDVVAKSIAENGGRSLRQRLGVWMPSHGRDLADALAQRLAAIVPRAADDPAAEIGRLSIRASRAISTIKSSWPCRAGREEMTARVPVRTAACRT
jgi:hypothetical protein